MPHQFALSTLPHIMPTYIRAKNPGGTFFLTFVSHKRRRFLKDSLALECLQDAYQVTVRRRRFLLRAYCFCRITYTFSSPCRAGTMISLRDAARSRAHLLAHIYAPEAKRGSEMCLGIAAARRLCGNGDIGSTPFAINGILKGISITSTSIL